MRIVPDSQVIFYANVDIVPGEQHLAPQSENDRNAYFASKVAATYTNTSMVRKDGTLLIDASVISPATLFGCNYLSFVNPSWGNKRFYGFIVDVDYMNNETMIVKWTLDEFESWRYEAQYDEMTIERESISYGDSLKNPYDPSILEMRTVESLPVGKDVEKPYYNIGTGANDDGAFIGDAICAYKGLDNKLGYLFCFSDLDLKSLDTGHTSPDLPSERLFSIMASAFAIRDPNFNVMSPSLFAYWKTQHPSSTMTEGWFYDNTTWGNARPLKCSRIIAPITYIFLDDCVAVNTNQVLGMLLSWFTDNSQTDNIIGIYPITTGMAFYTGESAESEPYYIAIANAAGQNVRNKKLDLYPFSYLRVIAPNGDTKELRIENFHDVQVDETNDCLLAVACDAIDGPTTVVAPVNYELNGISAASGANANTLEALVFSQFPTLPYIISGWESQRAAFANSIIANNTTEYGYQQELEQLGVYKQYLEVFGDMNEAVLAMPVSGTAMNFIGMLSSALSKGVGGVMKGAGGDINQQILNNRWAMAEDAYDVALGKKDTAIDNNFKYTRPAYAHNKYYKSNGVGLTNFMDISFADILCMRVSLNPEVLAEYDDYFDRYGYASGRIGIPRVINFMNGVTTPADVPNWINNKSYVKTANCTVRNVPIPVAQAIEQMFNAGIRFLAI